MEGSWQVTSSSFKRGHPRLNEVVLISSEVVLVSSEVVLVSSEVILVSTEVILVSSEVVLVLEAGKNRSGGEKQPRKGFVAAAGEIYGFGGVEFELVGEAVEDADAAADFFLPRKRWPSSVAAVSNFARPNRLLATA